jgi:hypothetical protein
LLIVRTILNDVGCICLLFAMQSTLQCDLDGDGNLRLAGPAQSQRAARNFQQGRCEQNQCGQFSISISNGQRGMTIRFESEAEFRQFLERGEAEKR